MTIEVSTQHEVMRHVPALDLLRLKLEDYREKADKLCWAAFDAGKAADRQTIVEIEAEFRLLCRSLERLTEVARHAKPHSHSDSIRPRLDSAFAAASAALSALDPGTFGRRTSETEFFRGAGELVWSALLVVGDHVRRLLPLVSAVHPDINEMILTGLVAPLPDVTLNPIA